MAKIQKLKDYQDVEIYPVTHERAVKDSNGVTLESKLEGIEQAIQEIISSIGSGGMIDVAEDGFFIVDSNYNIGLSLTANGLTCKNVSPFIIEG